MQKPPGKFIVLEGISGSGKSTAHERLRKEFPHAFFNVEPTYKLFGAVIRSVYNRQKYPEVDLELAKKYCEKGYHTDDRHFWLVAMQVLDEIKLGRKIDELGMQILFMADRVYDLLELVNPCRASGMLVLQDRYFASTLSYGASGGLDLDELIGWQMKAFNSFGISGESWKPDLMIIFDLDPNLAMQRLKSSGKIIDVFEEKLERLAKIRENYLQLAKRGDLFPRTVVIDADNTPDNVFAQTVQAVKMELLQTA